MNKLALLVLGCAIACMAAACPPSTPVPAPIPDVVVTPDSGLDAARVCSTCNGPCDCACCAMAWHNSDGIVRCKEALPTARGASCTQVCLDTVSFQGGQGMPTLCISKASTLEQLHACGVCR
jgi:hypothetical protein